MIAALVGQSDDGVGPKETAYIQQIVMIEAIENRLTLIFRASFLILRD
jgi:hypothetical protein